MQNNETFYANFLLLVKLYMVNILWRTFDMNANIVTRKFLTQKFCEQVWTLSLPDCIHICLYSSLIGANVRKVLKILDVLDSHTFYSCRAHNPLTTLYCSLSAAQCSFEGPLTDEMLTMLLCQWAVTPYRSGEHRPLVVAMLLRQRQDDIVKVHCICIQQYSW